MPEDEAVEQGAGGLLILGIELRHGLELKAQIGADAEGYGNAGESRRAWAAKSRLHSGTTAPRECPRARRAFARHSMLFCVRRQGAPEMTGRGGFLSARLPQRSARRIMIEERLIMTVRESVPPARRHPARGTPGRRARLPRGSQRTGRTAQPRDPCGDRRSLEDIRAGHITSLDDLPRPAVCELVIRPSHRAAKVWIGSTAIRKSACCAGWRGSPQLPATHACRAG